MKNYTPKSFKISKTLLLYLAFNYESTIEYEIATLFLYNQKNNYPNIFRLDYSCNIKDTNEEYKMLENELERSNSKLS